MNILEFFVTISFACFMTTNAIRWKDCGSIGAKVSSVAVSGCEKTDTCSLTRGKNSSVTVSFTSNEDFFKATAVVHGILIDLPVPFPIPNPDGCRDCGLTCPVKKGSTDTYTTNIFIKKSYPRVRVVVKWELQDENNKDIFCIEVPAEVSD